MIALLVITDGRPGLIDRTLASAAEMLAGPITTRVIYDDAGEEHAAELAERFPDFHVIAHEDGRQGFGGAIRAAWSWLSSGVEPFVFHLEDDFTFNRPTPLAAMAEVLERRPYLAQLALRRQPWNDDERAAGGIVEQHPDDYAEVHYHDLAWLEHRRFFTTNPSLYRRAIVDAGWPAADHSEGMFTHQLLADGFPGVAGDDVRFGYWGARDSGEWVTHIGHERAGVGY